MPTTLPNVLRQPGRDKDDVDMRDGDVDMRDGDVDMRDGEPVQSEDPSLDWADYLLGVWVEPSAEEGSSLSLGGHYPSPSPLTTH